MKSKLLSIALVLAPLVSFSQVYTEGKKIDLGSTNYMGKSFHEEAQERVLKKIRSAESFEDLPEYFEIMYPNELIELYKVSKDETNNTFDLQKTSLRKEGLSRFNIFSSEIGTPLKIYHKYNFNKGTYLDNHEYSNQSHDYGDSYYAIEQKPFEEGLLLAKILPTREPIDGRSGESLIKAYDYKLRHFWNQKSKEAYEKQQQDKMREIEERSRQWEAKQAKADSIRNVEYEKARLEQEKQDAIDARERKMALIKKYGQSNGTLISEGRVKIGFTKEMCLAAWGKPNDINRTIMENIVEEQWVYERSNYDHQFLYLRNGVLTTIQD
jgi:hypothetical protein